MTHIRKLLQRVVDQAAIGDTSLCILLESSADPDCWLQLTWNTINAAYPFADAPLSKIHELGLPEYPHLSILNWEPHKFVTFKHYADDLDKIAEFVNLYLDKALATGTEANALRIEEEQL